MPIRKFTAPGPQDNHSVIYVTLSAIVINNEHEAKDFTPKKELNLRGENDFIPEGTQWKSFHSIIKALVCFVTSPLDTRHYFP